MVTPSALPPSPAPAPSGVRPAPSRAIWWLLRGVAVLCLVLAVIGIIVPGMPATVFVLMSTWAAARSSPRLHHWLVTHRTFGPMIYHWEHGRTVSRRAKWTAAATMALSVLVLSVTVHRWWAVALPCLCMVLVLAWLWSRPEPDGREEGGSSDPHE